MGPYGNPDGSWKLNLGGSQFRDTRRGAFGQRKGMFRKAGFARSLRSRHPITIGPPAASDPTGQFQLEPGTGSGWIEESWNWERSDLGRFGNLWDVMGNHSISRLYPRQHIPCKV